MAAPRKYPDELRERATRMAVDARQDPATKSGTFRRVGEQLGINPETLRNWVVQAEIDEGHRPGTTTSDAERLAELEKEVRELRRANAILRSASLDSNRQGNTSGFRVVRSCWASSGVRKLKHFRGRVLSS
ncbi:Transposase [Brevibacterium antiquum CNRZ 918]|uniref:Transposase n=1 Tax=Brevibacterium antiquum CNRZ 918 TaxID=1255637 RepID=A0A2H1L0L9_9MICO|nr:transposase [Brevibacterium antiquum]SMY05364.1 Transposase [Brevibacterium antiquum CNRZ 918]